MDFTIFHFNDVYNVDGYSHEPKAGAARFCTALKMARTGKDSLTLFSGDAFSPSMLSTMTQGEHIPPILNELNIDAAVYGNHDFDFGVDKMIQCMDQTNFPWLNSNVFDSISNELFGDGQETLIIEKFGLKIGIIGLIESEWVATLATVDANDVIVKDFCAVGDELSTALRKQGCNVIVALTHMRWPNDRKLFSSVSSIDVVLGGHDHDFDFSLSDNDKRLLIKSGTDYRNIGVIDIKMNSDKTIDKISVEKIVVGSEFTEDDKVKSLINETALIIEGRMSVKVGTVGVDLDARFSSIRSEETNIGNLIGDMVLSSVDADVALINSGTLRADRIIPAGEITFRDLTALLPAIDPLVVLSITGAQLIEVFENGVSQYPKLEGRFPLVGGVEFQYRSSLPPGKRIIIESIKIQNEPLDLEKNYRLCVKQYLANGKDGYNVLADCPVLLDEENAPILNVAVQNYFRSIQVINGFLRQRFRYRSSVVSITRRKSIISENHGLNLADLTSKRWNKIKDKILDTEHERCAITPKIEGRIRRLD